VCKEVSGEQYQLKEDEAGKPYRSRSAEDGEQLFGGHRLAEEEEKRCNEDCAAEEKP
jgi:hypothetical protein